MFVAGFENKLKIYEQNTETLDYLLKPISYNDFLADGSDPVLSLMRMKELEDRLPAGRFVRVQKSYIVQMSKIEAIERSHIIIGKDRIPIGDSYQEGLLKALSGSSLLPK